MLEQRLGRPGYYLGTGIALAVVVIIVCITIGMVAGVAALLSWLIRLWMAKEFIAEASFLLVLMPALFIAVWLGTWLVMRRAKSKFNEREQFLNEKAREIQEHMDVHATHGAHEVVYLVGKDVEERLPEIQRQFDAWAREAKGPEDCEEGDARA